MEFPTIITDIIINVRKTYGITLDILNKLQPDDDYFLPLFEKDELSKIDIDMLEPSAPPPRIIAFGDIHGDLQALVGILYAAELIDVSGNWIEERPTYVVQTGDLFDNYRPEIKNSCLKEPENEFDEFIILNYLTHLHRQAQKMNTNSRIVLCIGNHELMNVFGHMKLYVMPGTSLDTEYRQNLFKPGGVFATKLSSIFRVIVKIGNNLFMHGGIHQGNFKKLDDIISYNNNLNKWLNGETNTLLPNIYEYNKQYLSITWYRDLIETDEFTYIRFLQQLDAKHELKVIVGHTVANDEVVPSIVIHSSGRIILLDTAMSRCWTDKNRKPCDLSNELYNISFIVIENDTIISKHKEALLVKEVTDKKLLNDKLKSAVSTEHDVQIIKTYNNIEKEQHWFSKAHKYHLVLFRYDTDKFGIATMNTSDHNLRKIYKIDAKTKIIHTTNTNKVEFENIINVSNNNSRTSFKIIFGSDEDADKAHRTLSQNSTSKQGGRKIHSRNNRNQNRTTKYKKIKVLEIKNIIVYQNENEDVQQINKQYLIFYLFEYLNL